MNQLTLDALYASIKHWEQNVEGPFEEVSIQGSDCALCKLFVENNCEGCPVAETTGETLCDGTPYIKAHHAYYDADELVDGVAAFREAARAELDFLKSLLPQPE